MSGVEGSDVCWVCAGARCNEVVEDQPVPRALGDAELWQHSHAAAHALADGHLPCGVLPPVVCLVMLFYCWIVAPLMSQLHQATT